MRHEADDRLAPSPLPPGLNGALTRGLVPDKWCSRVPVPSSPECLQPLAATTLPRQQRSGCGRQPHRGLVHRIRSRSHGAPPASLPPRSGQSPHTAHARSTARGREPCRRPRSRRNTWRRRRPISTQAPVTRRRPDWTRNSTSSRSNSCLLIDTTTAHLPGPQNQRECHLYLAEGCHLYIAATFVGPHKRSI